MKKLMVLLIAAFAISCQNTPAEKTVQQSALAKLKPENAAYKTEVAKLINDNPGEYTVTFNHYHKNGSQAYLNVTVEGNNISVTEDVLLKTNEPKVITAHEGKGYGGAQLEGLKVTVDETGPKPVLVYQSVTAIAD